MKILLTGAYGKVGTAIIDHLADDPEFDFSYFNRSDRPPDHPYGEFDTIIGDVTEKEEITQALEGQDAVIHLAASISGDTPWPEILNNNIIGGYNTFQGAAEQGVGKFIFASTNHVVGLYEKEHAPELYQPGYDLMLDHKVPVRPDSYYGVSKSFGEDLGRYYSETEDISFYGLRICSVRKPEYDHPYGDAERGVANGKWKRGDQEYEEKVARMKCMWHSRRDLAQLVEKSLKDETVDFDIFYGVSDNDRRWHDIDHARKVLGYDPQDNAEEWTEPPEDAS